MTLPTFPPNVRTTGARSGDTLLNLVLILLTPLFLAGTDGDLALARAAAWETVAAYRAQHHASLVKVARAIAFGLAALDSLGLSMRDDLAIPLILRLRANADALNRSAERAERALAEAPCVAAEPRQPIDETTIFAGVAEAQARATVARASLQDQETLPQPAAEPAPMRQPAPQAVHAPVTTPEQQNRALWGAAMADVAVGFAAEATTLPPTERRVATLRAQILSTAANNLLCGASVPPPQRPQPLADLAGLMQPPGR
jgi:hypothetical protein